ncbi:MAG: phosphate acyltransferase PlsX [Clostridiales bacterium]|jgi:glycerol-3-phosphate acyltransferase PlsX|nr:phosphate acyltransferase PlsX [Clostridiales bacterium]
MKIIVDAMGGDNGTSTVVKGALMAAEEFGVEICLVGKADEILQVLRDEGYNEIPNGIEISHASETIGMEEEAAAAARTKKDSSIIVGLKLLADGYGDAFVSAGNTGAILSGSTLTVKRIRGIRRAALAPIIPTLKGKAILIDCGANIECTPEYLLQFAYMGSAYAEHILGLSRPRVGLLNIGVERNKGTSLQRETYQLLTESSEKGRLNFVGNVESRDIMQGICDVIVTDGYSGNIFLKTMEGMGVMIIDIMRNLFGKNIKTKIAALMVKDGISDFRKLMDYNETGGAPLVGIAKPVIKAHGSSKAFTLRSAIHQAMMYVESGTIKDIESNIEFMRIDN